jgi:hypothetical protein
MMRDTPSHSATCTILILLTPAAQPEAPDASVYWSDPPDRVLARLRDLYGPEWWRW